MQNSTNKQTQTDRHGGETSAFSQGSMNQLQTYLQTCFHISSAVLKFDDVTMQSNPQMLLFLILIMQVAIKILFSQCKVPIELTHFGVMKRSCDPSLRKNVFDCVGVPLSPPERLIISALFLSTKFDCYHKHDFMRIFCLAFIFCSVTLQPYQCGHCLPQRRRNVSRFQPGGQTCKGKKALWHFWTSSLKFWSW